MLKRQKRARPLPCGVHRTAVYYRVGARKINVLKNAEGAGRFFAVVFNGSYAVFIEHNYLAGLYITYKFRPHRVKRAAFGSHNVSSVLRFAVAQRAKAVFITHRNKL